LLGFFALRFSLKTFAAFQQWGMSPKNEIDQSGEAYPPKLRGKEIKDIKYGFKEKIKESR
jgi:hypothetical protein